MWSLLDLIPYLATPFLICELSAEIRLAALAIITAGILVKLLLNHPLKTNAVHPEHQDLSPFHLVILAAALFMYFTFGDVWFRQLGWSVILSGVLITLHLNRSVLSPLVGLTATSVTFWLLTLYYPQVQLLFPAETFSSIVESIYPPPRESLLEPLAQQPLLFPLAKTHNMLFHCSITVTTLSLFMAGAFLQSSPFMTTIRSIAWTTWSLLLLIVVGTSAFLIIGITGSFYGLLFFPGRKPSIKRMVILFLLLIGCGAGYAGLYTPVFTFVMLPLKQWLHLSPDYWMTDHHRLFPTALPFFSIEPFQTGRLITLVMVAGLLLKLIENFRHRLLSDPVFPASIAGLVLLTVYSYPQPLAALYHPLWWLLFAVMTCCRKKTSLDSNEKTEDFSIEESLQSLGASLSANHPMMRYTMLVAALLLAVIAGNQMLSARTTENHLTQLSKATQTDQQYELAQSAFTFAPYRGDTASIYLSATTNYWMQKRILPNNLETEKTNYALDICAKYDYIPLTAVKRLANLYFSKANTSQYIQILRDAVNRFPNQIVFHETLAGALETLGDRTEAVQHYQRCLNIDPSLVNVREKLASLHKRLGDTIAEQQVRDQIETLNPTLD